LDTEKLEVPKKMTAGAQVLATMASAIIAVALQTQDNALAKPARAKFEARIAELKAKTAAMVSSALSRLNTLSLQQRLAAPPVIWRVTGPLTEFKDCDGCPQMVVLPAGEFTMGSPLSEAYRGAESQHRVTITTPFAVSKFEITFDEWDACVKGGGCGGYRPDDQNWGRGKRPVINISWDNAEAYVNWLRRMTGKNYRLLSESEWEYAARAGTTTPFSSGGKVTPNKANYDGSVDGTGPSKVNRQKTMPVGSFPANRFGLHDVHGNVSEWVADCWHDEYAAAPADGSPWVEGNCNGRVVRGGSWEDSQRELPRSPEQRAPRTISSTPTAFESREIFRSWRVRRCQSATRLARLCLRPMRRMCLFQITVVTGSPALAACRT
jgi:formylglycine-generating enzyme required for sulfatase activity